MTAATHTAIKDLERRLLRPSTSCFECRGSGSIYADRPTGNPGLKFVRVLVKCQCVRIADPSEVLKLIDELPIPPWAKEVLAIAWSKPPDEANSTMEVLAEVMRYKAQAVIEKVAANV